MTAMPPSSPLVWRQQEVGAQSPSYVNLAGFLLVLAGIWVVMYPYMGIFHDARLYAFLALNRLYPHLLENDIFVRHGSQDAFTAFSPLFAQTTAWLGLEHAAALLTILSTIIFLAGAWFLARQLQEKSFALLGIGLLLAVPTPYGSDQILKCLEGFLTPRLAAEGFVLMALAAEIAGRFKTTCVCLVLSAVLHPLMAAAGLALLVCKYALSRSPFLFFILIAASLAAGIYIFYQTTIAAALQIDDFWLETILDRAPYLALGNWYPTDWTNTALMLLTLASGTLAFPGQKERNLSTAALLVGALGIIVSFVGGDLLRITIILQAQPWRWLWLPTVITLVLLPGIVRHYWNHSRIGRSCALLLIATWLIRDESYAVMLGFVFSVLCLVTIQKKIRCSDRTEKIIFYGASALLSFSLIWSIANGILFAGLTPPETPDPAFVDSLRDVMRNGVLGATIVISAWFVFFRMKNAILSRAIIILMMAAHSFLAPVAMASWTRELYTEELKRVFTPWRNLIPQGEDVLWAEGAVPSWILLQRPSYISQLQTGTILFSRDAAMEMRQRAHEVAAITPYSDFFSWEKEDYALLPGNIKSLPPPRFSDICRNTNVKFIVTRLDLDTQPLSELPNAILPTYKGLRLYKCEHKLG